MKVAILGPWTEVFTGGVERHVHSLALALAGRYPESEFHVVSAHKHKRDDIIKKGNLTIHKIRDFPLPETLSAFFEARKIARIAESISPDIVHGQMAGAPYGLALIKSRKKKVLTVHSLTSHRVLKGIKARVHDLIWEKLERKEIPLADLIISVSENMKKELREKGARKSIVIENGIDKEFFSQKTSDKGYVLFVGRVNRVKNIHTLIEACRIAKMPLRVIGPIDDKGYYDEMDKEGVYFSKRALSGEELMKEYREASRIALVSRYESNPIVLYEAMALGKPIVASDVGGIKSIIKEGLVNPDDPREIAKALINAKATRKTKIMSWENCANETMAAYRGVLG